MRRRPARCPLLGRSSPVPEPDAVSMLLAGLAVVVAAARRRGRRYRPALPG
ncbi:PEP-CTERM sorting domain-containing protein [Pseudoduganella dura]|uniref:PEP-CTERM sorting domain-containing protein n=1 Tax=Pseudoduganella dura TaxID=321982 RepID=UPI003530F0B4